MSFLQPLMLFAIPLIALPIVIHLINQRRYQTMRWGAMHFLLAANRMSRGYARIRQWLILACRTLAIAGLILAACRPLASGILGFFSSSRADTTIVILDRSPSMSQRGTGGTLTKLAAARTELVATLKQLGSTHWVLIESERQTPRPIDNVEAIAELSEAFESDASASLPSMLETAANYMETNKTGRTEIWICSDARTNDWQRRSTQWQALRDRFLAFPQSVRFHLYDYDQPAPTNLAVAVTEVRRESSSRGAELAISLRVSRESSVSEPVVVPIQFEIEGARSQVQVELTGREYELRGHRIPIESSLERGSGTVSIPADINRADNIYYFAFDKPQTRRTMLVMEDTEQAAALQFAAEVAPQASVDCQTEYFSPHELGGVAWEDVALVLWQGPLPAGDAMELLNAYVDRGGQIVFWPPEVPQGNDFRGVQWSPWTATGDPVPVTTWKMDDDLLLNSLGGLSLPVGELQTYRFSAPQGDLSALATLDGGVPLLSRLATDHGGVYFCSTTTDPQDSTLASNGVVLYVAVQRALAKGAAVLGGARQAVAGPASDLGLTHWKQVAGSDATLSTDYGYHQGIYEHEGELVAVNRATKEEDHAAILSTDEIHGLFDGLDFSLVQTDVGASSSLVHEIWRTFLIGMIVALLAEALLCVPRAANTPADRNSIFRERQERADVVKEMHAA